MIDAWGIQHRYRDASGAERVVAPETVAKLREAIGEPRERPAALVTRPGRELEVEPGELVLEDGTRLEVAGRLPASLPLGYHALRDRRGALRRVVVSPGRCYLPEGLRAWGFAVQLYAARSRRSWGLGDLRDLGALAAWSASEHGAGFALVSPLHGVAPTDAQQASPYFPASRSFRNPIYLCVEDVPGAERLGVALESA
ncbi:MAG TPA: 4-alpha-glucanotransferase, partial [Myxococcota bacterium]|nr:4-alpha-glucanotransferase [Myxococcota bacterium]